MKIQTMKIADYAKAVALWRRCDGVRLHDDIDSEEGIARYLQRNRGMSFVAMHEGRLVGAVLCGHDGRRGYLHHLAVDDACRGQGLGKALVARAMAQLAAKGIRKCHIFILGGNRAGKAFWTRVGWTKRTDIKIMSRDLGKGKDCGQCC